MPTLVLRVIIVATARTLGHTFALLQMLSSMIITPTKEAVYTTSPTTAPFVAIHLAGINHLI